MLASGGLPPAEEFFGSVESVGKASRAVLPVFFGKADAVIVTLEAYETMEELNPQLSRTLETVVVSPSFSRALICVRDSFLRRVGDRVEDSLLFLHNDPQGRQLLTLFHVDGIVPFKAGDLDGIRDLLKAYASNSGEDQSG